MKTMTLKSHTFPLVMPDSYLGKKIDKEEAFSLLRGKRGKRDQVNGLVYHRLQLPTEKSDNGWKHVIRSPTLFRSRTRKRQSKHKNAHQMKHKIKTDDGVILVEYMTGEPDMKIKDAVNYFMSHHNVTRNIEGESGVMTMAGHRFDLPLSTRLDYTTSSVKEDRKDSKSHLENGAVSFHNMVLGTVCSDSLRQEISRLSINGKF